ncbi:BRO-N domain-containing protein [Pseudomonas japonica]|uniref:BRO family, N-terminal domain n=1 Tax=Pseudomonas japonica TaxID=256466 RepID=A0A239LSC8_9PSED|nr:BRO family protein [Pseudomonas japonica]SNT32713.1 BRO family, N-terminal domain [Pseudomonas japonica]
MGIELDVLVGHPEYDALFVATQVARAAGLKNFYSACNKFKRLKENEGFNWVTVGALSQKDQGLTDSHGRSLPHTTTLFDEMQVYKMLLRGHAPASEPFRKWVTEEVLPTIRKTGKYDAAESSDPIAVASWTPWRPLRGVIHAIAWRYKRSAT